MRELAAHVPVERDDLLDTAGTGGGRSSLQRLHHRRPDRRRRRAAPSPSTATARPPAGPARPTCSRRWARASTSARRGRQLHRARPASASCSPPPTTRRPASWFPSRRELAVRTIFNLLGPLTNPAGARRQLIGVSDAHFLETIAGALALLGVDRALVVAGEDGLDEISAAAPTQVVEVNGEELTRYTLMPREVGVDADAASPTGRQPGAGRPSENAAVTRAILTADGRPAFAAPATSWRVINAGAAIYVAGAPTRSPTASRAAREALADGRAAEALERYSRRATPTPPTPSAHEHPLRHRARADPGRARARPSSGASTIVPRPSSRRGRRSPTPPGAAPGPPEAALARARARGDRRVQAPLALRRDAAPRAPTSTRSSAPTSAAAPARSRSSPRRPTSTGRSRTSAPPARPAPAGPAQGLHRRPLPAARGPLRRRRRRAADRRRALEGRARQRSTSRRASSGSTCSSRSTTRAELERALAAGAEPDRDQQPRPARLQRRRRAHRAAAGRDPAGGRGRLGVGDRDAGAAARAARGRGSQPC